MYTYLSPSLSFILTIFILISPIYSYSNCNTTQPAIGCTTCLTAYSLAYNISQQKYTCTNIINCTTIQLTKCVTCNSPSTLAAVNGTYNACIYTPGCITYSYDSTNSSNSDCILCQSNYFLNFYNGLCYQKTILYCTQYQINNNTNTIQCIQCQYYSLNATNNCTTTNNNTCAVFDYIIMKCGLCPNNTIIQSEGIVCYSEINNCLYYDNGNPSSCVLCQAGYVYNGTICVLAYVVDINSQIVVSYDTNQRQPIYEYTCLNRQMAYNNITDTCDIPVTNHCRTLTSTACTQCIQGYFLSTGLCYQCDIYLSNCAICNSSTICISCNNGYYLLNMGNTAVSSTSCMSCSSYGCLTCSTVYNKQNKVQCLSCPIGSTLYAGSCFKCNTANSSYSIQQSKCKRCDIYTLNCQYCIFTNVQGIANNVYSKCIRCIDGYYLNGITCVRITSSTVVDYDNAAQILSKIAYGIDKVYYYDKNTVLGICDNTDGFICICNTVDSTSVCTTPTILPNITLLKFDSINIIAQYPNQLRMAAQLSTFSLTNLLALTFNNTSLLTQYQYWNLLQAISYIIIRQQATVQANTANTNNLILAIFRYSKQMISVFSDQKVTILRGNGFYFKYIPVGLTSGAIGDDNYISTTISSSYYVMIYAYYSKVRGQKIGLFTGNTYVFTNSNTSFNVSVKKTRYYDNSSNITVQVLGKPLQNTTISLDNGYLNIPNFMKSNQATLNGYSIYGLGTNATDPYFSQRIQNIFYTQSWLYVLFFIALYLIFIPLCAIVDCCQSEQYMRKKVNSNQPSQDKPKSQQSDPTIVKVNYRDFFPIYNVGNTPRPKRLAKVCLFIINMQHIVTFLTLDYFNYDPGDIIAIVLVIPAYICCVIMGYIVGAIFRYLPGHFKYLINILSIGYWILWITLMPRMASKYKIFIIVLAILTFFVDMVIDALETLLVYFAIKQEQKQIALFNCLARWLSYRGYYQFDKLAKQINQSDE